MQRSKFVFQETAGDQGVDVEKKPHRKVDRDKAPVCCGCD
jgi:hypothetical protein